MELERIIKELELKNDINTLKASKVVEKYASNENDAVEFMARLEDLFERKNMYAVNTFDKYGKIIDIADKIREKYDNSEIDKNDELIRTSMKREYSYLPRQDKDLETQQQSVYLLLNYCGVTSYDNSMSYTDLVKILYEKTVELDNYTKNGYAIPTVSEINYSYNKTFNKKKEVIDTKAIKFFYHYFPLMNLCYDKEFLVTSNYLLTKNAVPEETKEKIIGITCQVIDMTLNFPPIKGINNESFDRKEYKKVVKKTISNIHKYIKSKDKKEKTNKKEL